MNDDKQIILVACGTSIATSSIVVSILKEELVDNRGFQNITFQKCAVADLLEKIEFYKPDIVITTTKVDPDWVKNLTYFGGVPFLTGQGMEEVIEQIVQKIEEKEIENDIG